TAKRVFDRLRDECGFTGEYPRRQHHHGTDSAAPIVAATATLSVLHEHDKAERVGENTMPFRSRNIAREMVAAIAVMAIYIFVLLAPLHQSAGLQRDLDDRLG
ncbi:MAG: hypothetical protein ACOH2R_27520, partial [Pseudomonas sp.]